MIHRPSALLGWICLLLLGLARASTAAPPAQAAAGPAADLQAGRPFVAVVVDQTDRRLVASEAYADWHAYYTRFVAGVPATLKVHTLSPARAKRQLPALGLKGRNGTVFVDAQGQGLVHPGLILEPWIYEIGLAFAQTGDVAPQALSAGLRPQPMKP